MITQSIYLDRWDWQIKVFYAVDSYYVDEILDDLEEIGCSRLKLDEIESFLATEQYDIGLTYSNLRDRCSVVIIGLTSSPEQFQNTFDHEKGHLAMHICETDGIDPFSEKYQYLTGDIGQNMFKVAKRFLCEHCRAELKDGN